MSPELALAIAAAVDGEYKGPDYIRGLLAIGPEDKNFSDTLAKLIAEARLQLTAQHYAPDPVQVAKNNRRRLYSSREAQRQREAGAW